MKENSIFKNDGIVLLNKSKGISSFKAINKLKWIIKSNKVGHALRALDPGRGGHQPVRPAPAGRARPAAGIQIGRAHV